METRIDDLRIADIKELVAPDALLTELPVPAATARGITDSRAAIHQILEGEDQRLVVVVGPCSIHDVAAARDYATRLAAVRERLADDLEIVMRVYFEKPRTSLGWKGLINDPHLDDSFDINVGLTTARQLLLDINALGLPCGTEFLDMISPQFVADLISWGAIGARTTESQTHRELASGLSCPIGFKNGTDGNLVIAIDAIRSAAAPHHFLGVTKQGRSAILATRGNPDCHIILRGGERPNYDAQSVNRTAEMARRAGVNPRLMVDASHGNSGKDPERQADVVADLAGQIERGNKDIIGVMIESHLVGGRQALGDAASLTYGQSITDACLAWEATIPLLDRLAAAVRRRRATA